MPAADSSGGRRGGRLLTVLFWSGVGLAPLAALLLVIGQGTGQIRVGAALAILAIVLIGLSITLRRDGETVRADVEEMVYDELDVLRDDIRDDISHAARATHKSLADKIVVLHDTVEGLRGQVDLLRGQLELANSVPASHGAAPVRHPAQPAHHGPGVLRHTETVQVTTRQTMVVDPDEPDSGTVYGRGANGYSGGDHGGRRGQYEVPQQRRPERMAEPARHERYEPAGRELPSRPAPQQPEESWTEQLLRERLARVTDNAGAVREGGRRRAYDDDDGDPVTGMRTTDRWASVRSDDRGRELRMGERRAAMQAGESGTELRIEDRWASVLREDARQRELAREREREPADSWSDSWREEPRRSAARRERERDEAAEWTGERSRRLSEGEGRHSSRDDGRWSETSWEQRRGGTGEGRWEEVRRERRGGGGTPAALPASESASSWTTGWANAGNREENGSSRARHGASDDGDRGWGDDRGYGGRSRLVEFEGSDDRWR